MAYFSLGEALRRQDKLGEAKAVYDQALQFDPSLDAEIKDRLARANDSAPTSQEIGNYLRQYATAAQQNPDDHYGVLRAAVLHLYLGNRSTYESMCQDMLSRFGNSEVPDALHRTSLTCLLVSPPVGDLTALEQMAEKAYVTGGASQRAKFLYGRGRGLAAYRAGRWDEAIKWCAESRFAGQELIVSENVPMQDMLIEAMAYHQLGETATAQRLYKATIQLINKRFPTAPTQLGRSWFDWVLYEILRREAAELLGEPVGEPPTAAAEAQMALARASLDVNQWDEAAPNLNAVVDARRDEHLLAMQTAVLHYYRSDRDGYDRICRLMLERFGETEDPVEADRTAKACLLANPPAGEMRSLQRLAEVAVSDPEHGFYRFFVLVRALTSYRAGEFEAALAWCHDGRQRIGDEKQLPYLVAHYLVV
jgi:tetratricopeptide (TPR) repeat protein